MKFSAIEDIEAPIEVVFTAVSDFDGFERAALRRGARVQKVERKSTLGALHSWDIEAKLRGKMRKIKTDVTEYDKPSQIRLKTETNGMMGDTVIELVALSRNRTRLIVGMELTSHSLSARLMLQTLKLAKGKLTKRYRNRIAKFATDIEDRYKGGKLT